ncbi:hypothetical protein Pelo_6795 [Pelomyxa schiedti]|nr:hypothetical protein Pelo_6795 [Pelomyxa schiedti]
MKDDCGDNDQCHDDNGATTAVGPTTTSSFSSLLLQLEAAHNQEVSELAKRVTTLSERHNKSRTRWAEKIDAYKKKCEELEHHNEELKAEVQTLQHKLKRCAILLSRKLESDTAQQTKCQTKSSRNPPQNAASTHTDTAKRTKIHVDDAIDCLPPTPKKYKPQQAEVKQPTPLPPQVRLCLSPRKLSFTTFASAENARKKASSNAGPTALTLQFRPYIQTIH